MSIATGNSGNPIPDSISRGTVITALQEFAVLVADKSGWLTDADLLHLFPLLTIVGFALYGFWDHFRKRV